MNLLAYTPPDSRLEDRREPDEEEPLTEDEIADAEEERRNNQIEKEWERDHFPDDRDQT